MWKREKTIARIRGNPLTIIFRKKTFFPADWISFHKIDDDDYQVEKDEEATSFEITY